MRMCVWTVSACGDASESGRRARPRDAAGRGGVVVVALAGGGSRSGGMLRAFVVTGDSKETVIVQVGEYSEM